MKNNKYSILNKDLTGNYFRFCLLIIYISILTIIFFSVSAYAFEQDSSLIDLVPKTSLPEDFVISEEVYYYNDELKSSIVAVGYETELSYFPINLRIYKFEDVKKAKTNYDTIINDFQNEMSIIKFELINNFFLNEQEITKYSMELNENIRNNMYSWQDGNFVFIVIGPDVDNKDLALKLINDIYSIESITGDLNGDSKVNYVDLGMLGASYGLVSGDEGYNTNADLNGDNKVNYVDLGMLGAHYGETV